MVTRECKKTKRSNQPEVVVMHASKVSTRESKKRKKRKTPEMAVMAMARGGCFGSQWPRRGS